MTNNSNNHSCKKGRCYNAQIPGCRRIHCKLHDRVEWYCRWQHNKYRPHVHWGVVVILLVLIVLQIYTIVSLNIPRAYAAITLSQTKFSSNNSNDASISVIFDNIPAENNLLVAIAGNRDSSTPSTPSGWFVAIDQSANSPGQVIFYKIAGTSESTTVTVSGYSTDTRLGLHIYEYSGIDTTSPLDQTSSDNNTATIPDGETVLSGSVTTLQNDELLIAGFVINDGANGTNFSGFSNSFFIEQNDFQNSAQMILRSTYAGADRTVDATGTYSTSATASNSGDWRGQIATFKAAVVNSPPILGYTSDNVLGTATQETDGSGEVDILFKVKDADAPDTSTFVLGSAQYRVGIGAWNAVTDGSISFSPSSTFGAAADFSGTVYTLTWSSKDQIPTTDSSAVDFRFKVNDGDDNSAYGTATGFSVDNVDPTLTAGNLDIDDTSCTGTGGVCKIGNTIIFTWDNSGATGDGNSDETTVTADLSGFGGSSSQTLYDDGATGGDVTASDDIYTFALTVPADNDDGTNSFTVTVTDTIGNSTGPVTSIDTAPVDNEAPTITDANITIAGGTGTGRAYIVGDIITVSWVNDLINTDIASATADLSPWGGSSVATMTDTTACGGKAGNSIFEACFTLVSGSIDTTGVNTSVTATDDAGNTTGPVSDTTGATVDNQVPIAPGSLSDGGKTASTITLTFGAQSTVSDFSTYKIFYKVGTSGVTTSDVEHIDSDLGFINYNGTSDTTVTGLSAFIDYVFNIFILDDAGNSAKATEVSIKTLAGNSAPTSSWNSATQKINGSGYVDLSIEVDDTNSDDIKAKIEYETDSDGACNGPWAAATLLGPATADFSDTGGVPDINNANTYQVGSTATTRIITSSGSNTVQFDWDSDADLPSANETQCLQLTVNDDSVDSLSTIETPFVDNVVPTLTSVSIISDNTNTSLAKAGDTVTLSLTTSEIIGLPGVSFKSGGISVNGIVVYDNPGAGNIWTASYVVDATDTDGTVTFTVDFSDSAGNTGVQVTSVTDATSVIVDTTAPTAPGNLIDAGTATSSSITLNFGLAGSDTNFSEYKIFYNTSSGVTESHSLWTQTEDSSLGTVDYGSAVSTTVTSLAVSTSYYFNIWIYDTAGNSASATEVGAISTTSGNSVPAVSSVTGVQQTSNGYVNITYTLTDPDDDTCSLTEYEYSLDGTFTDGGTMTAVVGSPHDGISGLLCDSDGENYTFVWNAKTDTPTGTDDNMVYVRLKANDSAVDSSFDTSAAFTVDVKDPVLGSFTSKTVDGVYGPTSAVNITATYDALDSSSTLIIVLNNGESVTLSSVSGSGVSGTYIVGATGSGEDISNLTVSSIKSELVTDGFTNTQSSSVVPVNNIADTSAIDVDTTSPIVTEVLAVPSPISDSTPDYTFSTTEAGTIGYSGDCSSVTTSASIGANTVAFNTLTDGTHSNCTLTITDIAGNTSDGLAISPFTIDTIEEVSPPPPSEGGVVFFPEVLLPPTSPSGGFRVIINPLSDLTKISTRVNSEKALLASLGEITGANVTDNREVELLIVAGSDAVRVAISNNSDFSGAVQEPFISIGGVANVFQAFIGWKLSPWLLAFLALLLIILLTARLIPKGWIVIVILLLVGLLLWSTQVFGFIDIKIMRKQWTFTPEEGEKKVYVKVFTRNGVASETFFDTITYQKAPPEEKPEEEILPDEIKEVPPVEITEEKSLIAPSTRFTKNLQRGNYDFDVFDLQRFLNTNGFHLAEAGFGSLGNETSYFGPLTKAALTKFQESYTEEILRPWSLTSGTGYFGPTTRAFINILIEKEE